MNNKEEDVLFEYVLVVTLENGAEPKITYRFPTVCNVKEDIANSVPLFCFPEEKIIYNDEKSKETFSFTLTQGDGSKYFGYCRRFHVQNNNQNNNNNNNDVVECFCIISKHPSFSLFSHMLDIVEERRKGGNNSAVFTFLKSTLAIAFPSPGETFKVTTFATSSNTPAEYSLTRPATDDYLLDYISFHHLFNAFKITQIITLFECLLLERRIIFTAKKLSTISACINGMTALLNPFSWQYVFIPILPKSLLDYCCAPMPFIVGISSSSFDDVAQMPLEDIFIVDCDKGVFKRSIASDIENPLIPPSLRSELIQNLSFLFKLFKPSKRGEKDRMFDVNVARCFLSFFYRLIGDYANFIKSSNKNEDPIFDADLFLESRPDQYIRVLETLLKSQMWECFVREREEMAKKMTIDKCVFDKESENLWDISSLSVTCSTCHSQVKENIQIYRGAFLCSLCSPSSSTKLMKFFKGFQSKDAKEINNKEVKDKKDEKIKPNDKNNIIKKQFNRGNTLPSIFHNNNQNQNQIQKGTSSNSINDKSNNTTNNNNNNLRHSFNTNTVPGPTTNSNKNSKYTSHRM